MKKGKLISAIRRAKGWRPLAEVFDSLPEDLKPMVDRLRRWGGDWRYGRPRRRQAQAPYYVLNEPGGRIRSKNSGLWVRRDEAAGWKIRLYTTRYCYTITAHFRPAPAVPYLGCTVGLRRPRKGEDWCRGNDLSDGDLTPATWTRILSDIVAYELQRVKRPDAPTLAALGRWDEHPPALEELPEM